MDLTPVVSESIGTAVSQVFETMLGLKVINDATMDDLTPPPFNLEGVCGNVSFAGRLTGAVYFNLPSALSQKVAARIIGEGVEIKTHDENDVIGELTNMITGNLKSMMADQGFNCQLSIPNIIRGQSVRVSGKGFGIWIAKKFRVDELSEVFTVRVLAKVTP